MARVAPNEMSVEDIDDQIQALQVMKVKKQGRYSAKSNRCRKDKEEKAKLKPGDCNTCSARHIPGKCIAQGKECFTCGGRNHFSGSKACAAALGRTVNRVEGEDRSSYSGTMMWPGVASNDTKQLRKIS